MASEVSICNAALLAIGHDEIMSLEENNKGARACRLRYAETRDAMLRAHPWNFAVRRTELALLGTAPAFEFAQQFALPDDCLKVIMTESQTAGCDLPYRIEGLADGSRVLLCDSTTMAIEYIARVTDPNQMDALFRDALSARLAAEICPRMTDNASLSEKLWQIAENKLRLAMTMDAQEGTPRDPNPEEWILARL